MGRAPDTESQDQLRGAAWQGHCQRSPRYVGTEQVPAWEDAGQFRKWRHTFRAVPMPASHSINPNPMIAILDSARLKSGRGMLRYETTVNRFCHRLDLLHHLGKCFRRERLFAIRDSVRRVLMYFNDDAISTSSNTCFRNRRDKRSNRQWNEKDQ
ncbi:MAG: hypothetical protein U0Z26_06930 [Anaerolineales bacterium]